MLDRLNALPVLRFHYKLLFIAGIGWVFDSMDTGLIAFVLPLLIKEWGLTGAQAGMLGSIGLIGMALGAVAAGTVADRLGRKKYLLPPFFFTVYQPEPARLLRITNLSLFSDSSSASASAANCP